MHAVLLLLLLQQPTRIGTRAVVYTTADSSTLRLSPADTLAFKQAAPISEGQVYVFADPKRTFQTMIGIGGALTDAAAETFAKLPAERQAQLMDAYYSTDNNDMLHGGHLRAEYREAWALYYTKFIESYRQAGVPVWAITIQNEPMATQTWESCIYQPEDERDFLRDYLGPVMARRGLKDVNIIVWDHNRDLIVQRAQTIFDDPKAAPYAWGIGFHWYEDWSGGTQMYDNVDLVHRLYPAKHLIFTEGTPANFDSTAYGRWSLGEAYGRSMIHDFNTGAEGWTDWNILLDERGGPNHVGNYCFA